MPSVLMANWEYKVISSGKGGFASPALMEKFINDLGKEVKMPWELDGRKWHVEDRVSRSGDPVRWDGRILAAIDELLR